MDTGLRAAVIGASVASALAPTVSGFVMVIGLDWSFVTITFVAFVALVTPHLPVLLTARYEPVSRRGLIGLLVCVLVFGVLPAAGLCALVAAVGVGGFAPLILAGYGAVMLAVQLVAFGAAVRVVRGPKPSGRVPAHWTWV